MANVKEKTTINIEGNRNFDPITQTMFIEQSELCNMINGIFAPLFQDYVGSSIQLNSAGASGNVGGVPVYPNQDGTLTDVPLNTYYAVLIFRDRGEVSFVQHGDEKIPEFLKNLENLNPTISKTDGATLSQRFMTYAGTQNRSRTYDLNQDTRDALDEFMIRAPYSGNLNKDFWKRHIVEYAEQMSSGPFDPKFVAHVKVMGLSLDALVSKIFGNTDATGNRVEYLVSPTITPVNMGMAQNLLFQVSRLDTKNFKKLMSMMYGNSPLTSTYFGVNGRI